MPFGVVSPACSASCQPFLRSVEPISPVKSRKLFVLVLRFAYLKRWGIC